ncbi:MAG: sensor histidine kinase [Sphingomicrobium sp.]
MAARASFHDNWSTGTKLLVLLTLALFPLGLALAWTARSVLHDANVAELDDSSQDGRVAARAVESILARNGLALRIAANGALRSDPAVPCEAIARSLALTPAVASRFSVRDTDGKLLCVQGVYLPSTNVDLVAPGAYRLWINPDTKAIRYRVGVNGGMATGELTQAELAKTIRDVSPTIDSFAISDGHTSLDIITSSAPAATRLLQFPIARDQLTALVRTPRGDPTLVDRLAIFLPLLMWVVAALLSWYLARRLLLVPLARLERAVSEYQPGGESSMVLPERLGAADEIRSLGAAFERAVDRIEHSEQQMAEALHGQQRLVREVHHRVKNNLQVVASLLNIHGRSANTVESRAAYAAISRRVDALSVVHRNHFAEVEESRGIALRPLLTELGATLRASAPEGAAGTTIHLSADALNTTQDAAVAVAFFVTELVEFAFLQGAAEPIDIELKRISELAASLTVSSDALVDNDPAPTIERKQFERVVGGLARQLRSPLEQKFGRMSVNLPVFPN